MIRLRPATDADLEFLYNLMVATMREYVEATWGWDEDFQARRFRGNFLAERWQTVSVGAQDVGTVAIENRPDELLLRNLYLLPSHQGRGIGTKIVQDLSRDARSRNVPVTLSVLKSNPRAIRLYEKLGFRKYD